MSDSPFQKLVQDLFKATKQVDTAMDTLRQISDKIHDKYDPRAEFERWRDSKDGKSWKQKQYNVQDKCCAICKKSVELRWSHIDHIKPIASFPDLALALENLQIACPDCNTSKGNK